MLNNIYSIATLTEKSKLTPSHKLLTWC